MPILTPELQRGVGRGYRTQLQSGEGWKLLRQSANFSESPPSPGKLHEAPNQMWGTDATATFTEAEGAVTVFCCYRSLYGGMRERRVERYQGKRPIGLYRWDLECLLDTLSLEMTDRPLYPRPRGRDRAALESLYDRLRREYHVAYRPSQSSN